VIFAAAPVPLPSPRPRALRLGPPRLSLRSGQGWLLAITLAVLTASTSSAAAHAVLVEQEPAADAVLSAPPAEARLRFNEVVTPVVVQVLDASGRAVTAPSAVSETDTTLHIALPRNLADGSYVVSYRVISADSHPVGGSFVFAIGTVRADTDLASQVQNTRRDRLWGPIATALRALFYGAFLIAAGGGVFFVLIERGGVPPPDRKIIFAASGIAIAALVAALGVEGASAAAAPPEALLDPAIWRIGLSSTLCLSAVILTAGLAIEACGLVQPFRRACPVIAGGVILGAAGFAATGHVATAAPRWLTGPVLVLHVLCAAFWVGALPPLARRLSAQPAAILAPLLARFSTYAIGAVAMLSTVGIVIAAVQLETPAALIDTAYGRRVTLKLGLVAGLLTLAAVNRLWLTPGVAGGINRSGRCLHMTIAAELVLASAVVVVTAMLGEVPPPRALAAEMHAGHMEMAAHADGYTVAAIAGDRSAIVETTPALLGENRFAITFLDRDSVVFAPREVSAWLSLPALGIEPAKHNAVRDATGRYTITAPLPVAGDWRVEIDVLISDFERVAFTTTVSIR